MKKYTLFKKNTFFTLKSICLCDCIVRLSLIGGDSAELIQQ